MNRRRYLVGVAAGITGGLSGCSGDSSGGGGDGESDGDGQDGDASPTPTKSSTPTKTSTSTATSTPTDTATPTPEPATYAFLSVTPERVEAVRGESISISATIQNRGGKDGEPTVEVLLGGEELVTKSPTVVAGESTTVVAELDTADLATGSHQYTFDTGDASISGDLTVAEPTPEPTLVDSAIPEPTQGDLSQDGRDFTVDIENDGDTGEVGAALVYTVTGYDDIWREEQDIEDRDVVSIDGGATRMVTLQGGDLEVGESKFTFRLWPHTIEATVANEGRAGGTVDVSVVNDGTTFATKEISLRPGQEQTITFQTDFSSANEEPSDVDLEIETSS